MPDIAIGALVKDGLVLLARRSAERKVHAGLWSLPGGHIELGEAPEQAVRRELLEEIGVTAERCRFVSKIRLVDEMRPPATFHLYLVDEWKGMPQILDNEHTELRWFTASELASEAELAPPQVGVMLRGALSSDQCSTRFGHPAN
jgi:8-oxo-dGTP diphosphatase